MLLTGNLDPVRIDFPFELTLCLFPFLALSTCLPIHSHFLISISHVWRVQASPLTFT